MNNKLYVFSKTSTDPDANHLIAVLHKDDNGAIAIESRLDEQSYGSEYSLPILERGSESDETYQARARKWLNTFMPPTENKELMKIIMEKEGMAEYDEWKWLQHFRPEGKNSISFSEKFPKNCIRHDERLTRTDNADESPPRPPEDISHEPQSTTDITKEGENIDMSNKASTEKSKMSIKDFRKQQEANCTTDKNVIQKALTLLANASLKSFLKGVKNYNKNIEQLSCYGDIPINEIQDCSVCKVLSACCPLITDHVTLPNSEQEENENWIVQVLGIPFVNDVVNKRQIL